MADTITFHAGDRVLCKNNYGMEQWLTFGKVYTVGTVTWLDTALTTIYVVDDHGVSHEVNAARFENVNDDLDVQRAAVHDALRDVAYTCGRVWEAWQYNTMTQDDFSPAWEDDELIDSIIEAVTGRKVG